MPDPPGGRAEEGREYGYPRERLCAKGCDVVLVHAEALGERWAAPNIGHDEAASTRANGREELRIAGFDNPAGRERNPEGLLDYRDVRARQTPVLQ